MTTMTKKASEAEGNRSYNLYDNKKGGIYSRLFYWYYDSRRARLASLRSFQSSIRLPPNQ